MPVRLAPMLRSPSKAHEFVWEERTRLPAAATLVWRKQIRDVLAEGKARKSFGRDAEWFEPFAIAA
jgi:hypothetical protein